MGSQWGNYGDVIWRTKDRFPSCILWLNSRKKIANRLAEPFFIIIIIIIIMRMHFANRTHVENWLKGAKQTQFLAK